MKATKLMKTAPSVISFAAIGGKKENEGPLGDYFDKIANLEVSTRKKWCKQRKF